MKEPLNTIYQQLAATQAQLDILRLGFDGEDAIQEQAPALEAKIAYLQAQTSKLQQNPTEENRITVFQRDLNILCNRLFKEPHDTLSRDQAAKLLEEMCAENSTDPETMCAVVALLAHGPDNITVREARLALDFHEGKR